jgi:hypothetical protein
MAPTANVSKRSTSVGRTNDPVLLGAAVEQPRVADVPGGQVAERALALVLVLDQLPIAAGLCGLAGVLARSGLDRRLLIGAHDKVARLEQLPVPPALVQIQHPAGLLSELRVAREDPRTVVPWADGVLAEPPPDRDRRDLATIPRSIASRTSSAADQRESGTPCSAGSSHASALTSATCAGGKTPRPALPRSPRDLAPLPRRSVFATSRRLGATARAAPRSPYSTTPLPPTGSLSPAPHRDTDPRTLPRVAQARAGARSRPPGAETSALSPPGSAVNVMTPSNSPRISEDDHLAITPVRIETATNSRPVKLAAAAPATAANVPHFSNRIRPLFSRAGPQRRSHQRSLPTTVSTPPRRGHHGPRSRRY